MSPKLRSLADCCVRTSLLASFVVGAASWPAAAQTQTVPRFAPDSFWYKPIPRNAPLNPNSASYVNEFQRQVRTYYGDVGINITSYSSPVYVVGPSVPLQPVTQWDCHKPSYVDPGLTRQWSAVPVPDGAKPADGTDAEMTIYQPATDKLWEFWLVRQNGGQMQACWGGGMDNVSQNPGIWPQRYGASATGLPYSAGQVTIAELRAGAIHHVIGLALVDAERSNVISWPANRSDGWNPNHASNRIPEGLRLRLDPNLDVDSLHIHPMAKVVAKAAQTYGFVVWDKAGAISLRFENPKPAMLRGGQNPYTALWNGTPTYKILAGIPWDRLQFLPMDYGKPSP